MSQTLNQIYNETGIRFKDFVECAGKVDRRCVMAPLVALVQMYDKNPDKLKKLIEVILDVD